MDQGSETGVFPIKQRDNDHFWCTCYEKVINNLSYMVFIKSPLLKVSLATSFVTTQAFWIMLWTIWYWLLQNCRTYMMQCEPSPHSYCSRVILFQYILWTRIEINVVKVNIFSRRRCICVSIHVGNRAAYRLILWMVCKYYEIFNDVEMFCRSYAQIDTSISVTFYIHKWIR